MEIIEQIKQICDETDNKLFLTHNFTKIALNDLKLKELWEKENIFNFDERECVCFDEKEGNECIRCCIEMDRDEDLDKLKLSKIQGHIYDYNNYVYTKSKWIIPEKIDGEIPGFILIKCCGGGFEDEMFTHELVFACVRHKYRKKGILKNMVNSIPTKWNIWLEAESNDIENVENIWTKCGFSYHTTIHGQHLIYNKIGIGLNK